MLAASKKYSLHPQEGLEIEGSVAEGVLGCCQSENAPENRWDYMLTYE